MYKYLLFVILGIILFILYNNIDGFSIGGLNVGDDCSENDDCSTRDAVARPICSRNECLCNPLKNICELSLEGLEDIPIPPRIEDYISSCSVYPHKLIDIPMVTNYSVPRIDDECTRVYSDIDGRHEPTEELILSSCWQDCTTEECFRKYNTTTYKQTCKFYEINSRQNTLNSYNDFGYTKLDTFVDVNSPNTTFQEYVDLLNGDNVSSTFSQVHSILNIRLNEYLLKVYIEHNLGNDKHIKMIARGIFYCNGKIYYYISPQCEIRSSNSYAVGGQDAHERERSAIITRHRALVNKFHFLQTKKAHIPTQEIHLDYQKIKPLTVKDPSFYVDGNIAGEFVDDLSDKCKNSFNYNKVEQFYLRKSHFVNEDFTRGIVSFIDLYDTEALLDNSYNGLQVYGSMDLMGEIFFRTHENIDIFNIWLLLHAPYDNKTLGFIRLEGDQAAVNRQIIEATQIDSDSEQISSLTDMFVPYLNLSSHKNLYTFKMKAGDALKFKAYKTPHFGRETQSGVRVSTEGRYALLPVVFDLNDVFEIPRFTTVSRLSVKTDQFGNTPTIIPPYLPLTIYKWFQDEFDFILPIYDRLKVQGMIYQTILAHSRSRGNISVVIFKMILDNVPYDRYVDEREIIAMDDGGNQVLDADGNVVMISIKRFYIEKYLTGQ